MDEATKQDRAEAREAAREQTAAEREAAREQARQEKEALRDVADTTDEQVVVTDDFGLVAEEQRQRDRVADRAAADRAAAGVQAGPVPPQPPEEAA